jgi:ribulose-5-phosphate 4-epimerase/fuculose-1-phosphate aldolase
MDEKILPTPVQQIIFVSRETSNCPLIAEMIRLGQRLKDLGIADTDVGIVSLDYGKRLLINGKNMDIKKMNQHDVVEIVDYDPLKNIIMVIGTKDPCLQTPVHWIIQKARHDVNALLQINSQTLVEKFKGTLPMTEKETATGTLDQAKEILKTFRNGKTILIRNEGVLLAGINVQEIENALRFSIEGDK